eukprot:scaffold16_cov242-Pinguiococcus_pyrenoidosus.AAC.14
MQGLCRRSDPAAAAREEAGCALESPFESAKAPSAAALSRARRAARRCFAFMDCSSASEAIVGGFAAASRIARSAARFAARLALAFMKEPPAGDFASLDPLASCVAMEPLSLGSAPPFLAARSAARRAARRSLAFMGEGSAPWAAGGLCPALAALSAARRAALRSLAVVGALRSLSLAAPWSLFTSVFSPLRSSFSTSFSAASTFAALICSGRAWRDAGIASGPDCATEALEIIGSCSFCGVAPASRPSCTVIVASFAPLDPPRPPPKGGAPGAAFSAALRSFCLRRSRLCLAFSGLAMRLVGRCSAPAARGRFLRCCCCSGRKTDSISTRMMGKLS